MPFDAKKRSGTGVGNFNFNVRIYEQNGGENPVLTLPADAVRGLGDGRTTVMRHRMSQVGWSTLTPYPGLSTPDAVTIEGSFLFDFADLKNLQDWRDQAKGKIGGPDVVAGYFRSISVMPASLDTDADGVQSEILGGEIRLVNAIPVRLSFSDFDINSPAIMSWSLEVEYEDMIVAEPQGV